MHRKHWRFLTSHSSSFGVQTLLPRITALNETPKERWGCKCGEEGREGAGWELQKRSWSQVRRCCCARCCCGGIRTQPELQQWFQSPFRIHLLPLNRFSDRFLKFILLSPACSIAQFDNAFPTGKLQGFLFWSDHFGVVRLWHSWRELGSIPAPQELDPGRFRAGQGHAEIRFFMFLGSGQSAVQDQIPLGCTDPTPVWGSCHPHSGISLCLTSSCRTFVLSYFLPKENSVGKFLFWWNFTRNDQTTFWNFQWKKSVSFPPTFPFIPLRTVKQPSVEFILKTQ